MSLLELPRKMLRRGGRPKEIGWFILPMSAVLVVSGCTSREDITTYQIAKEEASQIAQEEAPSSGDRMVAAIVSRTETAWYFKLAGPADEVTPHVEQFRTLIGSLQFDDNEQPQWKLPAGWKQQAGQGMRFATLQPSGNASVAVSVINLPMPQEVLPNINRWRGQIGLSPIKAEELDAEVERLSLAAGEAVLVDLQGQVRARAMPPTAPPASRASTDAPAARPPTHEHDEWQHQLPADWKEELAGAMTKAAFRVSAGDQQAKITVSVLGKRAAAVLPNVNRWRRQLELEPISDVRESGIEELSVGGAPASYLRLTGASSAGKPQSMLAVIVPCGETTWFFKMMGDESLVRQQRLNFEAWLESMQLDSNQP